MLNSKSLKIRLIFLCSILSCVTLFVGGIGFVNLKRVANQYEHVGSTNLPRSLSANGLLSGLRRIRIGLRTVALNGNSVQESDDAIEKAEESLTAFETTLKEYQSSEYANGEKFGPNEKELFEDVVAKWNIFKEVSVTVVKLYKQNTAESQKKIVEIYHSSDPTSAKNCATAIEKLIAYQSGEAKKWVSQAHAAANNAIWMIILVMVFGIVTCMVIGFKFASSLSNRITAVSNDLSLGTNKVSEIANQVAMVSDMLSQNTSRQASSIQETSSSIEETSSMISKNADNAKSSSEISKQSEKSVLEARNSVSEMIHSIQEISKSNQSIVNQITVSNQEISDIVKVIAEIGDKTKVIHDIVFQTKLLSFNASVEAARAGEHGRGFAVVAEEVGNLAAMSGRSAAEISGLLDKSIIKVKETIERSTSSINSLMSVSIQKINEGSKSAQHCDKVLNDVVRQVTEVNTSVEEISLASDEQSRGVQEVNKAITELEKASQSNHSSSVEASINAEKLKAQVVDLRMLVQNLNQAVMGDSVEVDHSKSIDFNKIKQEDLDQFDLAS